MFLSGIVILVVASLSLVRVMLIFIAVVVSVSFCCSSSIHCVCAEWYGFQEHSEKQPKSNKTGTLNSKFTAIVCNKVKIAF